VKAQGLNIGSIDFSHRPYSVSGSAGQRDGKRYAILDMRTQPRTRVSFHRTWREAVDVCREMNDEAEGTLA